MNAIEKQVRMAADLYKARDAMRTILGQSYAARMKETGDYIERVAAQRNVSTLSAAISLAKLCEGMQAVMVLAAAVELTEPTPQEVSP